MRYIFEHKIAVLIISLTIVFLVFMASYTSDKARANLGKDGLSTMVLPFQIVFTSVTHNVQDFFAHFGDLEAAGKRIEELETQVAVLENNSRELEDTKLENERLSSLVGIKDSLKSNDSIAAQIIAKDVSNWYTVFTINKGSGDGIADKQAVITTKGLVGYVSEVGAKWAKVTTIINDGTAVGGLVVRTQDVAIVEGEFELQKDLLCKMTYISKGANIVTGDSIETSGLGGIYPKGILIGIIRDVKPETQTVSQNAIIEPAVNFEKVSEVLVLK
ncbi:MAG: rod shape-determining protein MreC [Clostridiales bacterium]|jgi:rod shape-determining protein MreC|nr:rod shape-determining protein MreC [Clostridiales bacterium]